MNFDKVRQVWNIYAVYPGWGMLQSVLGFDMMIDMKPRVIIFTDLDGTLLDHETYSWRAAGEALKKTRDREIPVILCSSKTRSEIEVIRNGLKLPWPFIVENGGGIFVSEGPKTPRLEGTVSFGKYRVLRLGAHYSELRAALRDISLSTGVPVRGFGDLSPEEVSRLTGLPREEAVRSQEREFDEPFILDGTPEEEALFLGAIEARGLRWTRGGRFHHLAGHSDKGAAVRALIEAYTRLLGPVSSVGVGDSLNDLPMLKAVDYPILVQRPGGIFDPLVDFAGIHKEPGIGPIGWNRAILGVLRRKSPSKGAH